MNATPGPSAPVADAPLLSVGSLHALAYCERLFFLEEVERIRVADASVFAGRRLHVELAKDDAEGAWEKVTLESDSLGICGTADVLRRRDGRIIPYEHKRGRASGKRGAYEAWESDAIQVAAYALLIEEAFGQSIQEARIRYHATKATVRVAVDEALRARVRADVTRGLVLRETAVKATGARTTNDCASGVPCPRVFTGGGAARRGREFRPIRLLPKHSSRQTFTCSSRVLVSAVG